MDSDITFIYRLKQINDIIQGIPIDSYTQILKCRYAFNVCKKTYFYKFNKILTAVIKGEQSLVYLPNFNEAPNEKQAKKKILLSDPSLREDRTLDSRSESNEAMTE